MTAHPGPRVGTILGGPRDGEIVEAYPPLVMIEQVGSIDPRDDVALVPTSTIAYREVALPFRRDHDGRGWWVYPRLAA